LQVERRFAGSLIISHEQFVGPFFILYPQATRLAPEKTLEWNVTRGRTYESASASTFEMKPSSPGIY